MKRPIALPADYKRFDCPENIENLGLFVELESFKTRWKEAKKKGIRALLLAQINIKEQTLKWCAWRASKGNFYFADRRKMEAFVNAFERFKNEK